MASEHMAPRGTEEPISPNRKRPRSGTAEADEPCRSRSHPYGVKPRGNLIMQRDGEQFNCRDQGLGALQHLTDAAMQEVISYCGAADLCRLSAVSRALYCFAHSEEAWKALTLFALRPDGKFWYERCWKQTYLGTLWRTEGRNGEAPRHAPIPVPNFYSDELFHCFRDATTPIPKAWLRRQNVPRRSAKGLSKERFLEQHEFANTPVVLTDLASEWPAFREWDWGEVQRRWGAAEFQCEAARLSLAEYCQYCEGQRDDRPIYLFDKAFTQTVPEMGKHFEVAPYFEDDLFKHLGAGRPDYRWLIMGPARSGSSFHVDPNGTDAWNACIRGTKRWLFYPPGVVPPGVVPSADGADVASPISIVEWFLSYYHRKGAEGVEPLEVTVRPGEVVFIPRGWWHLCLNITPTICITQNYVSRSGLPYVLRFLRDKPHCVSGVCDDAARESLYARFRAALQSKAPELLAETERAAAPRAAEGRTTWRDALGGAGEGEAEGGFAFDF